MNMPSYSARQGNDAVACPQCGGTGRLVEVLTSGAQVETNCGVCQGTGTVTRKQERAYYGRTTSSRSTANPQVSEEELVRMESASRDNRDDDSGTTQCPACRGMGASVNPKTGIMETCKLCHNSGIVSETTAKLWKTR